MCRRLLAVIALRLTFTLQVVRKRLVGLANMASAAMYKKSFRDLLTCHRLRLTVLHERVTDLPMVEQGHGDR